MKHNDWTSVPESVIREHLLNVPGWRVGKKNLFDVHLTHQALIRGFTVSPLLPGDIQEFNAKCLNWQPRDYQHIARSFLTSRNGSLLADEMRLGKTASALMAHDLSEGKVVVLGPLAAKNVWMAWFKRRFPNATSVAVTSRNSDMSLIQQAQCVFIHYDILSSWQFSNLHIGTLICDEAHILSGSNRSLSKRTQAAYLLAGCADRVIAITGTPLWNKPAGLFPILQLVNPGAWGSFFDYARRYCDAHEGPYGYAVNGISNEAEFNLRLSEVMLRRTWGDVSDQVPKITRTVSVVELTPADKIGISKALECEKEVRFASRTVTGDQATLRKLVGKHKVYQAIQEATKLIQANEPVVIWTFHKTVAKSIAKKFGVTPIFGETTQNAREKILTKWRNEISPLIISLGCGQVAIDLSHARHAIFAELDYTPTVLGQAEMRTFNLDRPMTVNFVVTDHPVEMALVRVLKKKLEMADKLHVPAADTALEVITEAFGVDDVSMESLMFDLFTSGEDNE